MRGALAEAFSVALGAALGGAGEGRARACRQQLRVASSAVEYLDAALGRAVYSEEVGRALAVSPRALNDAFAAVLGMSLHRYLRTRRLNLARRRLQAPEGGELVKTVALDLGFWHLGRFALEYRALFGETPSDTLAASGRGAPA